MVGARSVATVGECQWLGQRRRGEQASAVPAGVQNDGNNNTIGPGKRPAPALPCGVL